MAMSAKLSFTPTSTGTEFRLLVEERAEPVDSWAITAPAVLLPAVDLLNRLVAADLALVDDDMMLADHSAIAALSAVEVSALGLPPLSAAIAKITTSGLVTGASFSARIVWLRSTGQAIVGAERTGAWLKIDTTWGRLSSAVYAVAEA